MKFGTKMHLRVENLNWFGVMRKLMPEQFHGDLRFLFICLFVKMKICKQKDSDIPSIRRVYPWRKTGHPNLAWLQPCAWAVQFFIPLRLSFTASNCAAFKSKASRNSSFYFFFKGLFICVTHFTNSKCKNLIFSSFFTSQRRGRKQKSPPPPEMTSDIDFYMALNQFDCSIP